ncbi:MAG TPA: HEAT repeat domain-containing protein [Geobacteraceae bacterium]|nr:HEAT repeat domain-containing protein [Geobacteraceae bacterium]
MDKLHKLKKLLSSSDEETRRIAVVGLAEYPVGETKEYLFQALGDESWRVRKEAVELLSVSFFSSDMTEELIALLRSQDNAGLRNAAVEILVRLGAKAVPALHPYVNDPDHDVRKFIIDIMGSIGHPSFVPFLKRALDDPDANVRSAAVENLGKMGDQSAVKPLLKLLDRPDVWLQFTILEALGRIGAPVPISLLAPLADNELLKKAVYECVGAVGGAEGVAILLSGLGQKSKNARQSAACALDQLRERLSVGVLEESVDSRLRELKGTSVVDGLLQLLSVSDIRSKKAVVKILGIIGDERATAALLRGCGDDLLRSYCLQAFKSMGGTITTFLESEYPSADEGERCVITYLCGEMGLKYCEPLLEKGLADPLPTVRKEAVTACGKLGLAGLIPGISALLSDFDPEVREGAIFALARLAELDGEGVARVARSLVSSDDAEKRRDAAYLFGALRDAERLSLLMKDENVSVRKTAVSVLADLKDRANAGHLLMALFDEDSEVRVAAALALGETESEDAVDSLLLLLKDEDPWVQCAALKSLGKLRGEKAIQAVEAMLPTAAGAVMISAIEALASIGGERAVDLLEKALANEDEEVVKTAMDLLARTGDAWVEKHRRALMRHPHWGVRNLFAKLMADLMGERSVPHLKEALATENDDLVREQMHEIVERYR